LLNDVLYCIQGPLEQILPKTLDVFAALACDPTISPLRLDSSEGICFFFVAASMQFCNFPVEVGRAPFKTMFYNASWGIQNPRINSFRALDGRLAATSMQLYNFPAES
jgi:hypothetical protein